VHAEIANPVVLFGPIDKYLSAIFIIMDQQQLYTNSIIFACTKLWMAPKPQLNVSVMIVMLAELWHPFFIVP
jgi:hypothetical protein